MQIYFLTDLKNVTGSIGCFYVSTLELYGTFRFIPFKTEKQQLQVENQGLNKHKALKSILIIFYRNISNISQVTHFINKMSFVNLFHTCTSSITLDLSVFR